MSRNDLFPLVTTDGDWVLDQIGAKDEFELYCGHVVTQGDAVFTWFQVGNPNDFGYCGNCASEAIQWQLNQDKVVGMKGDINAGRMAGRLAGARLLRP